MTDAAAVVRRYEERLHLRAAGAEQVVRVAARQSQIHCRCEPTTHRAHELYFVRSTTSPSPVAEAL